MSSSQDPSNNAGKVQAGEDEVVAMDTTTEVADATSVWEVARENSSKMILESTLEEVEIQAATQKAELLQIRQRAEDAESNLSSSRQTIGKLEANLLQQQELVKGLENKDREAIEQTKILRESAEAEKERADRSAAESDRLREEIRYVSEENDELQEYTW